ncbi:MAG: glucose-1-phosphate adenylyltransferase subunit GlgD [Ruminococcaceae bacterium]|nr:glucose-1-phosphate adenylyltransferase subunit GlgD [Oscillospiraceae bacterium]
MKMTGIIFSNVYDTSLGDLTMKRTVASLPFGGRYRLVDFVLSNMVNSGISSIGLITKYNYQSLMDHLGSGAEWDLSRKNANFYILPPFASGVTNVYRGNLEALSNAVQFLQSIKPDYVVMCDTTVICNINYKKALAAHVASGADVTVIASRDLRAYESVDSDLVLTKDESGKATDLAIGQDLGDDSLVGMGMFIVERKFLLSIINNYVSRGRYSFEKDFLLSRFADDSVNVNVYEFKGPVLRNHSILSYFKNNFRIMDEAIREDIFTTKAPIYTKVRDEAPAYYAESSSVSDSLVADGCVIKGKLENTVVFRDVTVDEGAKIKNAIIMQGTTIGRGAKIENAIIDKNVTISAGATLVGGSSSPIIVHKGDTI